MDDLRLEPELAAQVAVVRERWFKEPFLRFSRGEGYEVDLDKGTISFGLYLGSSHSIGGVLHDMGHFVTCAENRIAKSSFGMGGWMPAFVLGRIYYERVPLVAYLNELDAMVFERVLQEAIGIEKEPYEEIVSSLVNMPSLDVVPGENDGERISWLAARLEEKARDRTIEEFDALWNHRVAAFPAVLEREKSDFDFHDEATYEVIETHPMNEGDSVDLYRVFTSKREAYVVISDLEGDKAEHGKYDDVNKARRRIASILEYNGWSTSSVEREPAL